MTEKPIVKNKLVAVDDPHAPDIYAASVAGFFVFDGVVHITLESPRSDYSDPSTPINRVTVARLVMPSSAACNLVQGLASFLQEHGVDPFSAPPTGSQPVQ